jgi:hypothetical protein
MGLVAELALAAAPRVGAAARAGPRRCWELAELRGALLTIGGLRRTWRVIPGRGITSHCRRVGDDRDRVALAVVGGAGRADVGAVRCALALAELAAVAEPVAYQAFRYYRVGTTA